MRKKHLRTLARDKNSLYGRISTLLQEARARVIQNINTVMVETYWLIGREIVTAEQKGKARAEYGKTLVESLSKQLTLEYGRGWSASHLWHIRQFYSLYRHRKPRLFPAAGAYSAGKKILHTLCAELSWSHYRLLMRVENDQARAFYEIECAKNRWSARELERQKNSLLYERLALSRDKAGIKKLAKRGQEIQTYGDMVKDPYILEFTGLSPAPILYETSLEQALCDNLSRFLLELGKGFTFVGRQKRLTVEGDHFYIDLVFYNTLLRCYVLIDLKIGKLTHQDIGQMQMYVNYYDRHMKQKDDNPTVGLILCEDKKDAVVRYTLPRQNRQIFASRYKLILPSEKALRRELLEEKKRIKLEMMNADRQD